MIGCITGHKPIMDATVNPPRMKCERCNADLGEANKDLSQVKKAVKGGDSMQVEDYEDEDDEEDDEDEDDDFEQPRQPSIKPDKKAKISAPKPKEVQPIEILTAAINHYTPSRQGMKAIEELGELQIELVRAFNGREDVNKIAEEMADVEIMLAQLKLIYKNQDLVEQFIAKKLKRLMTKLAEKIQPEEDDD